MHFYSAAFFGHPGQYYPSVNIPRTDFVPAEALYVDNAVAVSSGNFHVAVLDAHGGVHCSGDNLFGEAGVGDTVYHNGLVRARLPWLAEMIGCGEGHKMAVRRGRDRICTWGRNDFGQLGRDTETRPNAAGPTPKEVVGLPDYLRVQMAASGGNFCVIVADDDDVWAWGSNECAELGLGAATAGAHVLPVRVPRLSNLGARHIALGSSFGVMETGHDGLLHWGMYDNKTPHTRYLRPTYLDTDGMAFPLHAVSAGCRHCVVIDGDRQLWAWGCNWMGEAGDGSGDDVFISLPRRLPFPPGEVPMRVACGSCFTLIGTTRGEIYYSGWGKHFGGTWDGRVEQLTLATGIAPSLGPLLPFAGSTTHCPLVGWGTGSLRSAVLGLVMHNRELYDLAAEQLPGVLPPLRLVPPTVCAAGAAARAILLAAACDAD